MKVELVVNMSMNGEVVLAAQAGAYEAPQEISGMVFGKAMQSGNIILGLTSYQMFAPMISQMFPNLQVIVMNETMVDGVDTAASVKEAISLLKEKGFDTATIAGGVWTYNSFLTEDVVDDLYINLFPVAIHNGGTLQPQKDMVINYTLKDCSSYGNIVSLHYTK